jgi:hypothetical protein
MKKIILVFAAFVLFAGMAMSQTTTPVDNPNKPVAKFDRLIYDMGNIDKGIPKEVKFVLTNTGKEPLIIQSARASCGCTNLKYSSEPILAGKSIDIFVTYNAAVAGAFTKTITVITNADTNPVILQIKGTVVDKTQP